MTDRPILTRLPDAEALAETAAERLVEAARTAVDLRGRFVLVLSGGSTPEALYSRLATAALRERVPWDRTWVLFSDERCVPPDDPQSNYGMARRTLLEPAGVPLKQILRIEAERSPLEAAARYQLRMRELFVGELAPCFDLTLLGLGSDGHTASLFPDTRALDEKRRWIADNHVPALDQWRLTLTLPAINASARVLFLVQGASKAQIVAEVFGPSPDLAHPAARVRPQGSLEVLLDDAAAAGLP